MNHAVTGTWPLFSDVHTRTVPVTMETTTKLDEIKDTPSYQHARAVYELLGPWLNHDMDAVHVCLDKIYEEDPEVLSIGVQYLIGNLCVIALSQHCPEDALAAMVMGAMNDAINHARTERAKETDTAQGPS